MKLTLETLHNQLSELNGRVDGIYERLDEDSKNFKNIDKRFEAIEKRLDSMPREIIDAVIQGLSPFISITEKASVDYFSFGNGIEF
jgi:DNA-binding FrmR family transcriptional regulator